MKRLVLMLALTLATAVPVFAQVKGGNISGTVTDEQGGVLPGALVTVRGVDATQTSTTDGGGQYRFLELAPGAYTVTLDLPSFASVKRAAIVEVGRTSELPVTLKLASRGENITVTAAAPIVDPKVTGTSINFTNNELKYIPTSRDPFALARSVPGVLLDQVNIGGNETGQQPNVLGKASRQQDTSWTIDGIEVTDMGAPGQSPTYFNFDNFEEIQVATAGKDIRSRTGGVGINLITKRGTNQFHVGFRNYFSSDALESSNVPDELKALTPPVTPDTADHTIQSTDYGFDLGGPLVKDKAWFYASLSQQDIRIFKRSTKAIDKTKLRNPQVKVNWQATSKDMFNFLFFNGYKIKDGRSNPTNASTFEAFEATHHQDNAYSDSSPLHGLWKVGDDRVIGSKMFLSAKYAYYNTGFTLTPEGGMDAQAGRNIDQSRAYGSTVQTFQVRPQHVVTADMNEFVHAFGVAHDVKYGLGFRHITNLAEVEWPGNGILAIEQSGTGASGPRAQVFRQVHGGNTVNYLDFFVADSISLDRATIDAGLRYDRQWGNALASTADGSKAFPTVIPGVAFAGYESPFIWRNLSPRVGLSYLLDGAGKTVARASYSRFAGQLAPSTVGTMNPTTGGAPGSVTYKWNDLNGDHYGQDAEVDLTTQIGAPGGGFDSANPTSLTSTNKVDPDLKAPVTQSFVAGLERELLPNLAVMMDYTYNRTSNLFGNLSGNITPRNGIPLSAYVLAQVSPLTGTLPDGTLYSVPVYATPAGATNAGFLTQNVPGFYTDYHGLEVNLVKRLSNKWMGRLTVGYNNAREHFSKPEGIYDTNGNPTPTASEPLIDGGQFAPTASISTGTFMNAKWQFNANGMYQAPYGIELAANVFGRQGYPFPIYRGSVALVPPGATQGLDSLNVLVAPQIDSFRFDNVWDTDIRIARPFRLQAGTQSVEIRLAADVFNLFNANTELVRNGNIGSTTTFNVLSKNLSPRILRLGLVVGF